eukprot:5846274-Pleurochrysis_carterae.AAC.1
MTRASDDGACVHGARAADVTYATARASEDGALARCSRGGRHSRDGTATRRLALATTARARDARATDAACAATDAGDDGT